MKFIRQEDRTGCGIACVAMLSGATYAEVKRVAAIVLGWGVSQRTFYTSTSQLQYLLLEMNVSSLRGRSIHKWSSMPDAAIAGINYNDKRGAWHWVVFCREDGREYVMDPQAKRNVRTDFGRMRLRSCIPINLTFPS